jgi:arylsulfatase
MAVRAEIDNELTERSIAFMKQENAAGKPFFLYLPFSMGHSPNLSSKEFAGKSRIGQYGDKIMEGDYHVGQIMDALKEMNIEDNTILVCACDNGTTGQYMMAYDRLGLGAPDMGSNGPFRGDLGEATEGAIRTFCFIRWPGHVAPNTTSYAMFSIMDFMPTFASVLGMKLPTDRAIDGVNQMDVLTGKSKVGNRESLLSFIGPDIVAARWKQWRIYFRDMARTGTGQQMVGGIFANSSKMYYPKVYNIEMDPHEDLQMTNYASVSVNGFRLAEEYLASVKKFPNPPAANVTNFSQP